MFDSEGGYTAQCKERMILSQHANFKGSACRMQTHLGVKDMQTDHTSHSSPLHGHYLQLLNSYASSSDSADIRTTAMLQTFQWGKVLVVVVPQMWDQGAKHIARTGTPFPRCCTRDLKSLMAKSKETKATW